MATATEIKIENVGPIEELRIPIPCPWCKTAQYVYPEGEREFYCRQCKRIFDADPDEGGDFSDRNPAVRLEREERRAARGQQRR